MSPGMKPRNGRCGVNDPETELTIDNDDSDFDYEGLADRIGW